MEKLECLSGYIPFLQVVDQSICGINTFSFNKYTQVWIFYVNEDARKSSMDKLEWVRKEIIDACKNVEVTNSSDADATVLIKKIHLSCHMENLKLNALCKIEETRSF